jgi:uncharacterized protein YPO0396
MMQEKIAQPLIAFKTNLEDAVRTIEDGIDELNRALYDIDYVKDYTYIQLDCKPSRHAEIQEFRDTLKNSIPNIQGGFEENEKKFVSIRVLLDRLKSEERWSKLVTDVRNWLDFTVKELYREDKRLKEVYDSSAGKSGGQTVKLAYTILASAIAYQFGIREKKSFRLVVIDEMFNNLDNQNSRYAMDLFKQLGLQLLVITPMDKINVVEPYISSIHFVTNNQEGNYSRVFPVTIEKLKEMKKE